jgi:hypothetical protein
MITAASMIRWAIRLTHIPTGISVQTDNMNSPRGEGMFKARDRIMSRLKSRVWADQNLEKPPSVATHNYNLDKLGVDVADDRLLELRQDLRARYGVKEG